MDYFAATRAFVRTAELRNFSKAAKELGVKASTVSRQIAELERDLSIALFNRTTRGLALTEGGKTFLAHARTALAEMDEARAVTMALNQTPRGMLRVAMPPAFARRHVLPHLPAFLERYPDIDVDAVITDDALNLIESAIDLALWVGELKDSGLISRRLAPYRLFACAHESYLARRGVPKRPRDLDEHRCLVRSGAGSTSWLFSRGTRSVTVEPRGRFRSNDFPALFDMTLAGAGVALLPPWLADADAETRGLRRVLSDWAVSTAETGAEPAIWAVYPPKKTVSSKVRAFLDFFAARIGPALA